MNNETYLENILKKISVNAEREKQIRVRIQKTMKKFEEQFPDYSGYRIKGSFKRSTNLRGKFDIDINVIGNWKKDVLLKSFYKKVKKFIAKNENVTLSRKPPYFHAIPIIIDNSIEVDFLPSIKKNNGIYLIPEGYHKIIQSKPKDFEDELQRINYNTDGMSIKIIKLLKLWNYLNKKLFRSYQIERLVAEIFKKSSVIKLTFGIINFFKEVKKILKENYVIYDEIKQEFILDRIDKTKIIPLLERSEKLANQNQFSKIFPTI